jgi:twinkle protein
MSVREYLQKKHFDYKESGSEAVMNCPFCEDKEKKFAINLNTGAFHCFHENSCGKKGSFWDFQKLLGDEPVRLGNYEFVPNIPKVYNLPKEKGSGLSEAVKKYLLDRGFTNSTIEYFKIVQKDENTVMIPYIKDGKIVNFKYKDIREEFKDKKKFYQVKDAEPCLYNHDNAGEELIITEGEFDTMALFQYGFKAVSVPGGASNFDWVKNEYDWLEKFKVIYLCYDNDPAGKRGYEEAAKKLGEWRCKLVVFPLKDANDCLKEGISKEEIQACFDDAKDFSPTTLCSPGDFAEKVMELFTDPLKMNGTPTFLASLDKCLKGWRGGEVTIWSGQSGSGKTTILMQHMLHLAGQGIKVCVSSMEMPPDRYIKWGINQYLEKWAVTTDEVAKTISWMNGKIFIVNTTDQLDSEEMFSIFTYAARKYNVTHFIIDSLLKVRLPGNNKEYDEQRIFIDKLTQFAMKFNSHVHLVAHQRKLEKDTTRCDKNAVKGSGDITNLAANVLLLNRLKNDDIDASLELVKNRIGGQEMGIRLYFDKDTKRFREVKDES